MERQITEWIPKVWGGELVVVNNDFYCGKILYFMKDYRCSLHFHRDKTETFWLESGKLKLQYSDDFDEIVNNTDKHGVFSMNGRSMPVEERMETVILLPGDKFEIPRKRIHTMFALENSRLFEFSTTHNDQDSYRVVGSTEWTKK